MTEKTKRFLDLLSLSFIFPIVNTSIMFIVLFAELPTATKWVLIGIQLCVLATQLILFRLRWGVWW